MFSACLRSKRHTAVASEATSTTKIRIPVVLRRRPVPLMAKKLANISPMKPTYDRNDVGLSEKQARSSVNLYPIKKDPSDARETSRELRARFLVAEIQQRSTDCPKRAGLE
jgi:hypothetical protein